MLLLLLHLIAIYLAVNKCVSQCKEHIWSAKSYGEQEVVNVEKQLENEEKDPAVANFCEFREKLEEKRIQLSMVCM